MAKSSTVWTEQQYADYLRKHPERNSIQNHSGLSNTKPKRHKTPALGSPVQGEKESLHRITVRFTLHRVRPLDPDNGCASCKDCLDGLRHAKLLSGDEPWKIKFEFEQVKVSSYSQEKTEIEIFY